MSAIFFRPASSSEDLLLFFCSRPHLGPASFCGVRYFFSRGRTHFPFGLHHASYGSRGSFQKKVAHFLPELFDLFFERGETSPFRSRNVQKFFDHGI
jgi:hypothetical protein